MYDWQTIAALTVVALAIAGLVRLAIKTVSSAGSCGKCNHCPQQDPPPSLVQIVPAQKDN